MADPRKLQGTEEFLRLSFPGLLHRRGDKGCSGSLSSPRSANKRRFPVPWIFFLFEEKAATEEWWAVLAGGPLHSHRPTRSQCTHTTGHPACGLRGTAQSLRDTDLRRGLPTCRKGRGKWVDAGSTAPECALEMTLPPSSPHSTFTIPRGDSGTAACPVPYISPSLVLSATWRQTPGLLKAPARHSASTAAGGALSRRLSPSGSFPPHKEKAKRIWASARAHGSDYWHGKYCTC